MNKYHYSRMIAILRYSRTFKLEDFVIIQFLYIIKTILILKGKWFMNENIIRTISSEMNRYLNNYQMSKLQEVLYKKVEIEKKEISNEEYLNIAIILE